ncbi:MAG: MinD/ParA family protein [Gammaproteobacteria bacterium]|nr:MinD/ParA family protein [Gammaproteobacteria bacterium]
MVRLARVDQAEGLRQMVNPKPVRVIAVASGKGGVGKTNVSINLAVALAKLGRKPIIMDADLGLANVDVALGLQPKLNLSHVINGEASLEEIIVDAPGGIKVIPASSGVQKMATLTPAEHAGLIRAFSELRADVDVLIVDTAAGIDNSVVNFTKAAHEVIVVVCDEPASITDAYALIKLLNKEHGIRRFRVIANMAHSVNEGKGLYKKLVAVTDKFLDEVILDFTGMVPYDTFLRKAIQKQRPIVEMFPRAPATAAFKAIAQRADNWPLPKAGSGSLQFFVERLVGSNPLA